MLQIALLWVLFAIITATVADRKGRVVRPWVLYALILGPIAFIHILVAAPDQRAVEAAALRVGDLRKCPACAELVKVEAVVCRFCRTSLPEYVTPARAADVAPIKSDDRAVGMQVLGVIAACIVVLLLLATRSTSASRSSDSYEVRVCIGRGVAYFKEIDSYPLLSDGRSADAVAGERCRRATSAF
ncbi:MAG: hypothetical protein H7099_17500 [Gemmatimonadaceae bacterium]|nr:hypothetical protein [Gemmatimonadaceae bacterium]